MQDILIHTDAGITTITLNRVDVGANLSCRPPGQPTLVI